MLRRSWNQNGQSLVQVLVAASVMSVLMAAFATMVVNQNKEPRSLSVVVYR